MNLIKFTLAHVLLLLSFSTLVAQEESDAGLNLGVRAGMVVSRFDNAQPHTSSRLGLTVGASVEYGINGSLSIQAEPAYLQQGGNYVRFSDDTRFGDYENIGSLYVTNANVKIHTIDLPILAKYRLGLGQEIGLNLVLGPSISYTAYAGKSFERTFYYQQTFTTISGYEVVTSEYEKFTYGVTGGIGSEFSLGEKTFMLDFRYKYGISPIKKSYSYIDILDVQGDLTSDSFYFTLGLRL